MTTTLSLHHMVSMSKVTYNSLKNKLREEEQQQKKEHAKYKMRDAN